MCGICGIVDTKGNSVPGVEVRAMADTIVHRGPDDDGYFRADGVAFGFRRLSIVDLSGGHQPMSNEDGSVTIVFNGEIYNHADLRPELERRGHRYRTRSDTETIVHAYEEYGDECVARLRGMFSFAIWDQNRKRLFCARDRLGIKPFYFAWHEGRFLFGSEIKALLAVPGFRPGMNRRALPEFFALGYLSAEETLYEGVYKLLPGHRLSLDLKQPEPTLQIERYWDVATDTDESLSEAECMRRFDELFTESVRLRLMSDVPLGVFLSGGIDSSAIAAKMATMVREPIQTFSVGYTEDRYSELPYARLVAEHIGAQYNQVIMSADDFYGSLPRLIWNEDEPIVWPSSVALYFVSQLARQKVKVVLTGEGSDELLGGYLKYRITRWNLRYGPLYRKLVPRPLRSLAVSALKSTVLPEPVRRKVRHSFLYYPEQFEQMYFDNWYSVFPKSEQDQMFTPALAAELRDTSAYATSMRFYRPGGDVLNSLLYLDIKTYLVELLMKQDQMSMAASIESRVPFLDHKLVEFVARIPARHKLRFQAGKYLLRRVMAGQLPKEILNRTKLGFPTPIKQWLRNELFERMSSLLTDGRMRDRGVISPGYVEKLLQAHRSGRVDATDALWRLVNFELWCRIAFDRDAALLDPLGPQKSEAVRA